jgi:hypothetical protein
LKHRNGEKQTRNFSAGRVKKEKVGDESYWRRFSTKMIKIKEVIRHTEM